MWRGISLLLHFILASLDVFASDSLVNKQLPDSISKCVLLAKEGREIECNQIVKAYFRQTTMAEIMSPRHKELLFLYCTAVQDDRFNFIISNQKKIIEELGDEFFHSYIKHVFDLAFSEAVLEKEVKKLISIQELLLKRYLAPEDYLEGVSGLYQNYFIAIKDWRSYNFEVMRYFLECDDRDYLLEEVVSCIENLNEVTQVMEYCYGWLAYLSKKKETFQKEMLMTHVKYYLNDTRIMKKHFKKADRLALEDYQKEKIADLREKIYQE